MIAVGLVLVALAVIKEYEPVLLLPIGFGCILANLGMSTGQEGGLMFWLYKAGIETELFPLLIFVGVGAMIDFRPLLAMPQMVLLGAAGQFGIYGVLILATAAGFPAQRGRFDWRDWRDRWADRHLCGHQAGAGDAGADCGSSLLLYEPDPHHPAADHAADDHPQGTPDPHGICSQAGIAKSA